jgi:hypothetical protein
LLNAVFHPLTTGGNYTTLSVVENKLLYVYPHLVPCSLLTLNTLFMLKTTLLTITLCIGMLTMWAKTAPSVAEKVPVSLKHSITNAMHYPKQANNVNLEGVVWLKFCVSDDFKINVLEMSSSTPELGEYVKDNLMGLKVRENGCQSGKPYYLKVRFDDL